MQKQKKNFLKKKSLERYRKIFKYHPSIFNSIITLAKIKFKYQINFKITQNNIFCTLINIKTKTTILVISSGKEKIKISKKTLKFNSKNILLSFFKKIKTKIKIKNLFINIIAPLRIKLLILKLFAKKIKNYSLLINTEHKKCFNGCKKKKKKRKKQRGLRIFK